MVNQKRLLFSFSSFDVDVRRYLTFGNWWPRSIIKSWEGYNWFLGGLFSAFYKSDLPNFKMLYSFCFFTSITSISCKLVHSNVFYQANWSNLAETIAYFREICPQKHKKAKITRSVNVDGTGKIFFWNLNIFSTFLTGNHPLKTMSKLNWPKSASLWRHNKNC